jgi:uncharacterized membrane protein YphA (DoxX/SURF4 family)
MDRVEPTSSPAEPLLLLAVLRLTLGVLFVWVFFENLGKDLYTPAGYAGLIHYYIEKGTAPAAWKAVMRFMADHAAVAAPAQAVIELGFGVLLVAGFATRLVGLAAFGWLTSLWVSEWGTAWIWELLVPMVVAACVALGGAGRRLGLDAALARRYPAVPLW